MEIIGFIIIGILAGWIAGLVMRGRGYGLIADFIIGVVGAVIGGFLFRMLGVEAYGALGALAMAIIGAVVFLGIAGVIHRA